MSEELQMPSFDYTAPLSVNAEDLAAAEQGGKFLEPGVYTAKISNVEYKGLPEGDKTFGKYLITFMASNEKTIRKLYMVPLTSKWTYGAKDSKFPVNNTKIMLRAAGLKIGNDDDLKRSFQGAFQDVAKSRLLGREVQIKVGYATPYVAYAGKDAEGTNTFMIKNADGSAHEGFAGRVWTDRDTLAAEADEAGVKVSGFAEVLEVTAVVKSTSAAKGSF